MNRVGSLCPTGVRHASDRFRMRDGGDDATSKATRRPPDRFPDTFDRSGPDRVDVAGEKAGATVSMNSAAIPSSPSDLILSTSDNVPPIGGGSLEGSNRGCLLLGKNSGV